MPRGPKGEKRPADVIPVKAAWLALLLGALRLGVTNTEQAADTGQQISLARVIVYARRIG